MNNPAYLKDARVNVGSNLCTTIGEYNERIITIICDDGEIFYDREITIVKSSDLNINEIEVYGTDQRNKF